MDQSVILSDLSFSRNGEFSGSRSYSFCFCYSFLRNSFHASTGNLKHLFCLILIQLHHQFCFVLVFSPSFHFQPSVPYVLGMSWKCHIMRCLNICATKFVLKLSLFHLELYLNLFLLLLLYFLFFDLTVFVSFSFLSLKF